jgi:hypothetical protein
MKRILIIGYAALLFAPFVRAQEGYTGAASR